MGDWLQARKIRLGAAGIFTYEERCRGVIGYAANVRFAPNSGRKWVWRGMSAYDPKRTFEVTDDSLNRRQSHKLTAALPTRRLM